MTRFAFNCGLSFAVVSAVTASACAVMIDTVPVGNVGNQPDRRYDATGFGSVSYSYRIGKFEVTAGQYAEFLNAVADADLYELYNAHMGEPVINLGANIQRSGNSGSYQYSVAPDWATIGL